MNTAADAYQPPPAGIGVDEATKKVKNKDTGSVDSDDVMMEPVVVSPVVSFRDRLLGEGSTHSAAIPLEEEDEISIGKEDYIATVENGVPSITFSDRINGLLDKRMELCVIIKLLGRRITYNVLSNKLDRLWRTKRPFHLSTLENDYYMAKFQSKEDYVMVLFEGLWLVFGHCLTVQPWIPTFDKIEPYPMDVSTWIKLPGLPSRMYVHDVVTTIDKQVGKVIRVDSISEVATKTRFAHIAVCVDLRKALPSKIKINGRFQRIEYDSLPFLCFKCDNCPRNNVGVVQGAVQVDKGKSTMPRAQVTLEELVKWVKTEEYGSWMVVKRQEENELAMDNLGKDAAPNYSFPMATRINNIRKEQTGSTSNLHGRKNANELVSEAQKQANTVGSIRKGPTDANFKKVADGVAQITNAKQPNLVGTFFDPEMPMELGEPVHDNHVFVSDRETENQRGAIDGERFREIISMTQFQARKMGSSLDPKQNSVVRMEENYDPKEVPLPHSNRKGPKKAKSTVTVLLIISQVVNQGRPKAVRKVSQVKRVVGDAESSAASACVSEAVAAMIRTVDNLKIEMSAILGSGNATEQNGALLVKPN
ncbi:hypothetical protein K2173_024117 [Erythroxylum novogranatense]|uniref:DUF4283 domain-containing protein n=1 Tax=Erythroxylum novogranatense TaxID=1862640 RepID=A0AAV8UC56_9ROSI|nr:hypothetical protein K2173_024117 [Erythroxylum novogranatense]